jgi:hypothetical protein
MSTRSLLASGVVAIALLAGCADEPTQTDDGPGLTIGDRPDESFGDVETGPAVGPDLDATTAEAPRLVEGEWWRIRFQDYLNGIVEVVRVVADVNEEGYIMGMPHEGWLKEAISFHSPAFGDVRFDLSYNTHNMPFEPVRFPLVAGDTWETHFAAAPYAATVESADEYTADIVFEPVPSDDPTTPLFDLLYGPTGSMHLTYDARQHEVVRMESVIGTWEVVEHGYGYEGWVTVPRGEDTVIDYGTFGPPADGETGLREVTVEGGFNRLTMMHAVFGPENVPGRYEVRDVDPAGTEMVTEYQGAGFHVEFYETNVVDGVWQTGSTAAGLGATYHMGIAYFQYDIHLPDGQRRADHGVIR